MENWVEPARPLTLAEQERAFIINNKIFEVLPRHGTLQAGQAQQVGRSLHQGLSSCSVQQRLAHMLHGCATSYQTGSSLVR